MERHERIKNILSQINPLNEVNRQNFSQGFQKDYQLGRDDSQMAFYRTRNLKGQAEDAPLFDSMAGTHMGVTRLKELTNKVSPERRQALIEADMHLDTSAAPSYQAGQIVGTAAADLTQDTSRSVWWLLNALQATGNVVGDQVLKKAAPELWGRTTQMSAKGGVPIIKGKEDSMLMKEAVKRGMLQEIDGNLVPSRGYSWKKNVSTGNSELQKRNYSQGMLASLAIPGGVAINSGLGLLTPFGGAEGYKAIAPDPEDPTKTNNIVSEVAQKYLLGRSGNLLPYDEFKKVRPDVSKGEYAAYQADKYDNRLDLNPFDGDISLPGGMVKANVEGIHGPEVSILGRSLPATTGGLPFATAIVGTALGARRGMKSGKGAMGGLVGGTAGVGTGIIAGSIIEGERRRRNSIENGELPL